MAEPNSPRTVVVWDLPTRLFHWALAVLVAALWISGHLDRLDLHMKVGAATLALLLFRLAWGVVGSPTARFAQFVGGPRRIAAHLRGEWSGLGHNPLGALSVLVMLGLLLLQAASGLFATDDVATDGPLAWLVASRTTKLLSAFHRLDSWAVLAMVALHLAAIGFYRVRRGENLVRPMIVGTKTVTEAAPPQRLASPWLALALLAAAAALVFGGLAVWGK